MNEPMRSNLVTRLLTAALVAPLIVLLVYFGPPWAWFALVLLASGIGAAELFGMTHPNDRLARAVGVALTLIVSGVLWQWGTDARVLVTLITVIPFAAMALTLVRLGDVETATMRIGATAFGPLWIGMLTLLAVLRRDSGDLGPDYVVMALMFAWFADTGGYFVGRQFGRHKLYEAVSPKKTVEGFAGAILGAVIGALLAHFWYLRSIPLGDAILLALAAGAMGQLGDLGESLLKRSTGVKDSGGIVPGHGGILDRIDALFVTSAIVYLYVQWR
jgi:phosphatidate cytidylyltransferase